VPIKEGPRPAIFGARSVTGSLTGTPIENEDDLAFSVRHGIRPMVERMPLTAAPEAYERMMSEQARFRVVLDMTAA